MRLARDEPLPPVRRIALHDILEDVGTGGAAAQGAGEGTTQPGRGRQRSGRRRAVAAPPRALV